MSSLGVSYHTARAYALAPESRMNCFSPPRHRPHSILRLTARLATTLLLAAAAACNAPASADARSAEAADAADARRYGVDYEVRLEPASQSATVVLSLSQSGALVREMRFSAGALDAATIAGDGDVELHDGTLTWLPPEGGGELRWQLRVRNERNGGYDAWLDNNWGLFRAEDVIPRAYTRTLKGAHSVTRLRFTLPVGWSVVTEYAKEGDAFSVLREDRRFAQPAGWIVAGDLGVRRERIAGIRVAVAAPVDQDVRRMDMLALSNWILPELARLLPAPPPRITIVSAGEPMWRGGLSAPQSIFIHADRPMISENGTSTLVHELMHVGFGLTADDGYDWIVEGLAEFYTIELLRRSGTITADRYDRALDGLAEWARQADALCRDPSTGARTALAVGTFSELDRYIDRQTRGERGLDDVVRGLLARSKPVNLDALSRAVEAVVGEEPELIDSEALPGCRTLAEPGDERP